MKLPNKISSLICSKCGSEFKVYTSLTYKPDAKNPKQTCHKCFDETIEQLKNPTK